ncbi:DUF5134 domain-containing protein [Kribbella sp. WER1]
MNELLTVVFGTTALYCLWRLATGRGRGIDVFTDVNHVLMGAAMLAMLWWPAAGVARWLQVVLFGGAAVVFLRHLARFAEVAARAGALMHAAMNLGMVWMLTTMPMSLRSWTGMLSWVVTASLALAAGWWVLRAARCSGHRLMCCCHALATAGTAAMLAAMNPIL